ncbi:hypothetical protein GLP30_17170 [Photobacterium phosphoreum]|uniref:PIN domain-containing protein n=1 Tax=Photobacterium phosphoreum TaxID=659 RepID=A0AAW4ZWG4_PHOPO|nr:hypothetical protein [Photobacterium phosphoreum]MCD9492615.1 hypothetical protein [Photobacterium phosphoreum]MCF2191820.1 hypothetical protein [Photobacterium phosphoreum]MCF2303447.1 hypothetical protein [Photobacterium phosphoreum]
MALKPRKQCKHYPYLFLLNEKSFLLNWINEEMTEIKFQYDADRILDFIFELEDHFDKAEIEIIPYILNGISYELIENTETIILTNDYFQLFVEALRHDRDAVNMIVITGDLQNNSQLLDGTPIQSSLITLQDFSKTIQPLLNYNCTKTINHWRDLGCQFINIDFLQKSFKKKNTVEIKGNFSSRTGKFSMIKN